MKIKDLIEKLNAIDPTGEIEVCISGNEDIVWVEPPSPGWYDGTLIKVECENYKPKKITYAGHLYKVKLFSMSVKDAVTQNPDITWDDSGIGHDDKKRDYRNKIETYRAKGRILKKERTFPEIKVQTIIIHATTKKLNATWSPGTASGQPPSQGKKV